MSPAAVATASSKSKSHSKHSRCIPTHKRELMPSSLDMNLFRETSQQFTSHTPRKGQRGLYLKDKRKEGSDGPRWKWLRQQIYKR